ncbi:MAG: hypothetical protein ACFFKA_12215, partial [Candidatus Thorarchaeota archaeon]
MIFQLNLSIMDFIVNIVISLIALLVGVKFISIIAKEKNWDNYSLNSFVILTPWFIIDIFLGLILTIVINNFILILLIKVFSYLIISSYLTSKIYNLNWKYSFSFVLIIQIILILVPFLLKIILIEIPELLNFMTGTDYIMNSSIIMFFILLFTLTGFTLLFVIWGNKMQLVKRKKLIAG